MENLKEIIEKLESARKEQNLSYEQVAKTINTSRQTIWKILTELNEPNAVTFLKLIDVLGFDFIIGKKHIYPSEIPKENTLIKGKWIEESGPVEKKKFDELIKEKSKSIPRNTLGNGSYDETLKLIAKSKNKVGPKKQKKVSEDCPNCKYAQTQSGLTIKTLKCADCKTNKKK